MHGPVSAAWLLVALCLASGAYCLLRMRTRGQEGQGAAGEALMGFGMAVMAVPAAFVTLPPVVWFAGAAAFTATGVHAALTARRSPHHLHHLVGSAAMVYMSLVMAAAPAAHHTQHAGPGGLPAVTGLLLVYFAGYALLAGVRLIPAPAAAPGSAGPVSGPAGWGERAELALVCRLTMAIAMVSMLLAM
ncbi:MULTISPECIES: DUF5134 domain-containing protein [Streptomyces]|uniref:DUF5134 domain-containing protein n=1 Tax=Streptomyces koyangensis TaxID=188770 RepID=A0ABX7ELV8_9ACTN|nr:MULTISPECIES: DUF5134 domain-containing protein [Streptomyces]QRF05788.1 DUF5134 domain-containing protein [Streptomyces koyangensis]RZF05329.1 DUF5134 domain-containing protein [Streptomyces sp. SCA2-2]